jgi:hypothetical protein
MPPSYMVALDRQVELIKFWRGPWGPSVADYWANFLASPNRAIAMSLGSPAHFAEREARSLDEADTYWVAPPIVDLLDSQRQKLPSYELRGTDIPSRTGFAYLARPVYILDRHGRRCNIRAFSWQVEAVLMTEGPTDARAQTSLTPDEIDAVFGLDSIPIPDADQLPDPGEDGPRLEVPVFIREDGTPVAKAVRFFVYSDRDDPDDEGWGDPDDAALQDRIATVKQAIPVRLSLFHVETWMLNQRLPDPDDPDLIGSESFLRVVAAFWTFCNQKVTAVQPSGIDRHTRRRAQRAGLAITEASSIKVVILRREYERGRDKDRDDDAEPAWYSHSFLVDGHWRRQWYPSEGRHKPLWIEPFVKGDGPFIAKDKVFNVRR